MRYRVDPALASQGMNLDERMLFAAGLIGLAIGIGMWLVGRRVRQRWLAWWGGSLVLASAIYVGWVLR